MEQFSKIVEHLGDVSDEAAKKWRQRGRVAPERHLDFLAAAAQLGILATADDVKKLRIARAQGRAA